MTLANLISKFLPNKLVLLIRPIYHLAKIKFDLKKRGINHYYDKSFHYVRDAADNWCDGIMTHETVKKHTEQKDLFS